MAKSAPLKHLLDMKKENITFRLSFSITLVLAALVQF